jgi:hypothetical protein
LVETFFIAHFIRIYFHMTTAVGAMTAATDAMTTDMGTVAAASGAVVAAVGATTTAVGAKYVYRVVPLPAPMICGQLVKVTGRHA